MGWCSCFGLLRNNKELKSDCGKRDPSSFESRRESASRINADFRPESSAPKDRSNASNRAVTFTYEELVIATSYFKQESLLGRGGFGAVYKGKLEGSDQVVAVKRLDPSGFQGEKEFLVEVLMLSLKRHPNLVNLIGYCADGEQRLLVYEYMPLGSLEDYLFDLTHDRKPLDWNTRMKIASGVAKGLDYLHSAEPPVIYRDLKASNILLDEGFHPKLSDFGLAKFGPVGDKSHVSTRVMGTYGYCAPEYASTGRLTMKTDIYSFGIVLLELITGRRAIEEVNGRHKHLINWAFPLMKDDTNGWKLADPLLGGHYSTSVLKKVIELTLMCLSENVKRRPSSSDLAVAMEYLASHKYEPREAKKVGTLSWPEIVLSPSDTDLIIDKEIDRDRAVAEAKLWGKSWREKRTCGQVSSSDEHS